MKESFNLFSTIRQELDSFFNDRIHIAGKSTSGAVRFLDRKNKSYEFSQWDTLNTIDLYYNSKFETGPYDSEGQQKIFLNICQFRADVASKMIDLDTKDFLFIPEEGESEWPAFFYAKEFRAWAKENYFGELINEFVENFPKYGTCVAKKVGDTLERVKLINLRNQQDATSLSTARFVIEEHANMTIEEMQAMTAWDLSELKDKTYDALHTVYERYGFMPLSAFKALNGETATKGDEEKMIDTLAIVTLSDKVKGTAKGGDQQDGVVLFLEKISSRPYQEVHWKRQDGRWLGIGEIENQFENQVSRNMIVNMRRRALLWSSKKVFQSPDTTIAKNLIRDVKDGDVLSIMPNGNITQVDMSTREVGEFQSFENVWEKNSDQKSFTYEVATGQDLPSGTPFRLGVLLSNAVKSHFDLKQEKLGLFFKRLIIEFVMPVFEKENSQEHLLALFGDEEGVETLRQFHIYNLVNDHIIKSLLSGVVPNGPAIRQQVEQQLAQSKYLFAPIPASFYKNAKLKVEVEITGESVDTKSQIETLTNLYTILSQRGDPRADKILNKILGLTGTSLDVALGPPPPQQPQQQGQPGQPGQQAPGTPPGTPVGGGTPAKPNALQSTPSPFQPNAMRL